jgi:Protein of unknown function (DUF4236)
MKFNLRTSKKIAPGLRINLSKKGASASVGAKGVRVRTDKHGISGGGKPADSHAAQRVESPTKDLELELGDRTVMLSQLVAESTTEQLHEELEKDCPTLPTAASKELAVEWIRFELAMRS